MDRATAKAGKARYCMKSYSIRISTYGSDTPELIETSKLETKSYLNPDDFMYFGEYDNCDSALDAYAKEKGDSDYCKSHDC